MKKLLFLLGICAASFTIHAQATAETKGPVLSFVNNSNDIDYGTLDNGADGTREVTIQNTGTEPLIITKCNSVCGCTIPTCPSEPILPGKTAKIRVHYDTIRTGSFVKQVTIDSNDPSGTKLIRLHGNIRPPASFKVSPEPATH